ncbi:hypothetical protein IQ25_02079 [Novosphingobium taihuense]|uniref:Uncharacterized protein n=1 Tax=Novosphingobium taihuense TaxID=260085 RepID=A0A7W7AA08_9SPHN|nr:hypothetical protein [Novosphingobium taihuense]TWH85320.1 hypothetical protein IQ25_02079 [Novosphingobium taihuense]
MVTCGVARTNFLVRHAELQVVVRAICTDRDDLRGRAGLCRSANEGACWTNVEVCGQAKTLVRAFGNFRQTNRVAGGDQSRCECSCKHGQHGSWPFACPEGRDWSGDARRQGRRRTPPVLHVWRPTLPGAGLLLTWRVACRKIRGRAAKRDAFETLAGAARTGDVPLPGKRRWNGRPVQARGEPGNCRVWPGGASFASLA